ncbi:hypothetical protein FGO68_gene8666 [Halteria grandinella]|uniref:MORN repeat protein n=1 Tax=Halteria grandinella TaxID=5974 RepID=A0A8J8T3N9_HALGN|nr:hypothetical protein FGO68_gene8666 [Halteria grandinella]
MEGCGIILCIDDKGRGHFYACEWKDGFPINEGVHIMTDDQWHKFEGPHDAQLYLTGHGRMTVEDGAEYIGEWKESKFHGQGILKKRNGWSYFGTWKENDKHGEGIQTETNGDYYQGLWSENEKVQPISKQGKERGLTLTKKQSKK